MNDDKLLIEQIADHYGWNAQLDQTVEELSELILAIQKIKRHAVKANIPSTLERFVMDKRAIQEELTDVRIMIDQIEYLLNPDPYLMRDLRQGKLMRQIERIEKEKARAVAET